MTTAKERSQSRTAKWGWGILLVLSALMVVNAVSLFFIEGSLSSFEQDTGVPLGEFRQAYPTVANHIAREGRNISIVLAGLGLLALLVALEGFRHGSRWAWNGTWVLVGVLAGLGVHALIGGNPFIGLISLFMTALALVGQLLARRGLAP